MFLVSHLIYVIGYLINILVNVNVLTIIEIITRIPTCVPSFSNVITTAIRTAFAFISLLNSVLIIINDKAECNQVRRTDLNDLYFSRCCMMFFIVPYSVCFSGSLVEVDLNLHLVFIYLSYSVTVQICNCRVVSGTIYIIINTVNTTNKVTNKVVAYKNLS